MQEAPPFTDCFRLDFGAVYASASAQNTNWPHQLSLLPPKEREYVDRDSITFLKVKQIMANSLSNDQNIRVDMWTASFSKADFVDFV